jgi:tRNA (Thr-GGU) A37 N-methylase
MPVQTVAAQGVQGSVELEPTLAAGLKDLAAFSHLILLTHLRQMAGYALETVPKPSSRCYQAVLMAR